ncbi:MAG: hypothetical protein C4542_04980 [Dehalococcoidia bacterium]|nr:MAG: hypothetical protein C4542_04980 [Dehalococcoidia bacterium]
MKRKEVSKRKPGAQPGNQNARTHGFYARVMTPEDRELFEAAAALHGLDYEIALLRMKILSILAHDPQNHAVLVMAINALTKLLKTKQQIAPTDIEQFKRAVQNVLGDRARTPLFEQALHEVNHGLAGSEATPGVSSSHLSLDGRDNPILSEANGSEGES